MDKYQPQEIEKKWQKKWAADKLYAFDWTNTKDKFYTLVELPYTSGDLHIGHWFTWTAADAFSRFQRMNGKQVLFPHGYDAFGLPAENAAIKRGVHPKDWTLKNIENMQKQFKTMGSTLDIENITVACLPEYYQWNQWIFLKMYEKGIAYRGKALSNWCPKDQTVLADEHVEAGKCWRCGTEVEKKEVSQWFLKITDYADQLLWTEDNKVDWPQMVRVGQNNWIGKSEGVEMDFQIADSKDKISVFTTALDTIYGATFMVLAPEHPLVDTLVTPEQKKEIETYRDTVETKSELERKENKEKTGVFTGGYVINPFTSKKMPVWIADYVLFGYGTGAIMAVPGHDARDNEFAKKFGLEIVHVVKPKKAEGANIEDGGFWDYPEIKTKFADRSELFDSGEYSGMTSAEGKEAMTKYIEKKGIGKRKVQYHIRDWSISRQRYWGTPVPIIHCKKCGIVPVPEKSLPVELPYEVDYQPKGKPPLASNEEWLKVKCPNCGGQAEREAETLDTFFDSAWYYYRYLDPSFKDGPFDTSRAKQLMPVDVYFGGAEHTLGHTLYARFFTKFFKDLGLVGFDEFAHKRVQHGVVLGPDGARMSKSRGNVINPDDVVGEYGADAVRLYLSFMMAFEDTGPWNPNAIAGVYRFLKRVWGLYEKVGDKKDISAADEVAMNKAIKKVTDDLPALKNNTAVAALMEWLNHLSRRDSISKKEYEIFVTLLAPFGPHIAEELWEKLGNKYSVHNEKWPAVDTKKLMGEQVNIPVQVNGKLRAVIAVDSQDLEEKNVVKLAESHEKVKSHLAGQKYKIIYIKGKLLNLVTL